MTTQEISNRQMIAQEDFDRNDWCLVDGEHVCEDVEEYIDYILANTSTEELQDSDIQEKIINKCSAVEVYDKDYVHITASWLTSVIEDHCEDNYGYDGYDGPVLPDVETINNFVNIFNEAQGSYITDDLKGYLDISQQVREEIDKILKEESERS